VSDEDRKEAMSELRTIFKCEAGTATIEYGKAHFYQSPDGDSIYLAVVERLEELQAENARLQGELASLRSQVIPWRDGGKRGAELPKELSAYGVDALLVIDDEIIKAWTCNEGCEIIFDEGPQCDGFREWCDVDYYVPLSELPLPQEPTDGN
jgi:hypothetical protein